jgi:hypothetical protein
MLEHLAQYFSRWFRLAGLRTRDPTAEAQPSQSDCPLVRNSLRRSCSPNLMSVISRILALVIAVADLVKEYGDKR